MPPPRIHPCVLQTPFARRPTTKSFLHHPALSNPRRAYAESKEPSQRPSDTAASAGTPASASVNGSAASSGSIGARQDGSEDVVDPELEAAFADVDDSTIEDEDTESLSGPRGGPMADDDPLSALPEKRVTRLRRDMYDWLNGPGSAFLNPLPGSTNYLSAYDRRGRLIRARSGGKGGQKDSRAAQSRDLMDEDEDGIEDGVASGVVGAPPRRQGSRNPDAPPPETQEDLRPFPLNKFFVSQPVLSEELREVIYDRVRVQGQSVRDVSVALEVAMDRVAAVVRLKEVEKRWVREGKPLVKPYASAVLSMLPTTPYTTPYPTAHEPINDLPVHSLTLPQLFVPAPESRAFTRADAAKAFDASLLPADARIPHPQLIVAERERLAGAKPAEIAANMAARDKEAAEKREAAERRKAEWERKTTTVVKGQRWDFKFSDISAEDVGRDGRSAKGVGWRYGVPHQDRKRGLIKIPTRV